MNEFFVEREKERLIFINHNLRFYPNYIMSETRRGVFFYENQNWNSRWNGMHFSFPDYSIIRIMSQADAHVSKEERKKGMEPLYICKSDSALNKILTDQSNVVVGGGGTRRTRFPSCTCVSFFFLSSPMNTLSFFVTFCVGIASICIHTQIMRAHASLVRVVKDSLSRRDPAPLSNSRSLRRVIHLLSHLPRVPRGLFKSKTSLSRTERILVSETLIITTWRCPDSRLFVRSKGRNATSGEQSRRKTAMKTGWRC